MLIEMLKKRFFNLHINYMTAFDWIILSKKILTLHSGEVSSSPKLPLVFVIVFWGETNRSSYLHMFFKLGIHKNVANSIGKHQC